MTLSMPKSRDTSLAPSSPAAGVNCLRMARDLATVLLMGGASQRLLLAHAPAEVQRRVLAEPLEKRTARNFCEG